MLLLAVSAVRVRWNGTSAAATPTTSEVINAPGTSFVSFYCFYSVFIRISFNFIYLFCSSDAAGFPIAPLLVTADELAAGAVNHALRFIGTRDKEIGRGEGGEEKGREVMRVEEEEVRGTTCKRFIFLLFL